ncbi:hypothetical protein [Aerococcus urinaeequi]|uniref:hypothetical protein n=1 Tax=Aerococcus urinaeequi TaxID=51665 RepID=UPI003AABB0D4
MMVNSRIILEKEKISAANEMQAVKDEALIKPLKKGARLSLDQVEDSVFSSGELWAKG